VLENVCMGLYNPRGADQYRGQKADFVCDPNGAIRRARVITVMVSQSQGRDKRPRRLSDEREGDAHSRASAARATRQRHAGGGGSEGGVERTCGRGTRTRSAVWSRRGERARDRNARHPQGTVLEQMGA